jgi:hypothetical protein
MKKKLLSLLVASVLSSAPAFAAQPQSAPPQSSSNDNVVIFVVPDSDTGYSAKKSFIGKAVYSDDNKKIGTITDLIIAPDTSLAYVVIGAGGFVGMGRHNVAVETNALQFQNGKFVLPGATKETLKSAPKLEYPKKRRS